MLERYTVGGGGGGGVQTDTHTQTDNRMTTMIPLPHIYHSVSLCGSLEYTHSVVHSDAKQL